MPPPQEQTTTCSAAYWRQLRPAPRRPRRQHADACDSGSAVISRGHPKRRPENRCAQQRQSTAENLPQPAATASPPYEQRLVYPQPRAEQPFGAATTATPATQVAEHIEASLCQEVPLVLFAVCEV